MEKKGLIGSLLVGLILLIAIIVCVIYLTGHFGFKTGKVSVNIEYDKPQETNEGDIVVIEIPTEEVDSALEEGMPMNFDTSNNSLNYTNISETHLRKIE